MLQGRLLLSNMDLRLRWSIELVTLQMCIHNYRIHGLHAPYLWKMLGSAAQNDLLISLRLSLKPHLWYVLFIREAVSLLLLATLPIWISILGRLSILRRKLSKVSSKKRLILLVLTLIRWFLLLGKILRNIYWFPSWEKFVIVILVFNKREVAFINLLRSFSGDNATHKLWLHYLTIKLSCLLA